MNACEDFFKVVIESHVLSAILKEFNMSSLDDTPSASCFDEKSMSLDSLERSKIVMSSVHGVVKKFTDLSFGKSKEPSGNDYVFNYACDVFTLGLFFLEFNDSVNEGDGLRILRCWRYLLLIFFAKKRKNYSYEAFRLLVQHDYLLSPRMAHQLIWSRTLNTHGRAGHNVPCDIHMEHLNALCKSAISGLGSNISEKSVDRVGRCISEVAKIAETFDSVNSVPIRSGKHNPRSRKKDVEKIIEQLTKYKVFQKIPERNHKHYKKYTSNVMKNVDLTKLQLWMTEKLQLLTSYND